MDTNRLVLIVAGIVVSIAVLVAVAAGPVSRRSKDHRRTSPPVDAPVDDRRVPPVVDGQTLLPVDDADRPPLPKQWVGNGGIPSATWWSSAVAGPGAVSLWPQPLGLRITATGEVQVAAPATETRPDGTSEAPFVPALFLDIGPARTTVTGHGPLHVVITLVGRGTRRLELTLVQGSPVVELRATGPVHVRAPGLAPDRAPAELTAARLETSVGPWVLAAADATPTDTDGDDVTIEPADGGRLTLGPLPTGDRGDYVERVRDLARHPLVATTEDLSVEPNGTTAQELSQIRTGGPGADDASLWTLQPHHQRYAVHTVAPLGSLPTPTGPSPVIAGSRLRLVYPAIPLLWSTVPMPGGAPLRAGAEPVPEDGGSYFGGKAAYAWAARGDALTAADDRQGAKRAIAQARQRLDELGTGGANRSLRWDDRWGSVVIAPAEFGVGTELNDHHLQYGYWVAAAAHLAELDPSSTATDRDLVDLLVADYAGAATVPGVAASLPDQRTWSPYEGHGWASGTAAFSAGNNLESISESSLSWWAAARWFLATDRPDVAELFIARLTIESAVTGDAWLPQGSQLPTDETQRPWSGVVWSSKVDHTTWFDPADESALGIMLLPVGPASLARYGTPGAVEAADHRWTWCETQGGGCTTRWANLLDSDAAVAGRPLLRGPDPEPSTTPLLANWWRDLWTRTTLAEGWSCSTGAVARHTLDGATVVLASNPGPRPVAMSCRDPKGVIRWSGRVQGTTAARTT